MIRKGSKPFSATIAASIVVGMGAILMSCNLLAESGAYGTIPPPTQLVFPVADYESLVVSDDNLIALTGGERVDNVWWFASEGDQELHQIIFYKDPNCSMGIDYFPLGMLPDERIQLLELCRTGPTDAEVKTQTYLVAYSWKSGKMEELISQLPRGLSNASWNPDQTRAIAYMDSGFARGTLFWILNGGFGPADIEISEGDKSWNLKNFFPDFPDAETLRTGNTGRAAWSSDGKSIAFFASAEAIGKEGFDRFNVEYKLYLMDAEDLEPYSTIDGIYFPFLLEWSPDSRHIAFIGQHGLLKQDGIWLYSLDSDTIVNIAKGQFQDILWKSDGESLFAIHCKAIHECSEILEFDLTEVVSP